MPIDANSEFSRLARALADAYVESVAVGAGTDAPKVAVLSASNYADAMARELRQQLSAAIGGTEPDVMTMHEILAADGTASVTFRPRNARIGLVAARAQGVWRLQVGLQDGRWIDSGQTLAHAGVVHWDVLAGLPHRLSGGESGTEIWVSLADVWL